VSVVRLLLAHGLRIVGIGSAIGIVVAGVAYRFMDGMIFGHWTLDLATLAIVVAVFGATTLAACVMPARHALRVDPMQVLRSE
jgi:putative ABC transport system permease protein